jgi:hypothetical protein
MELVKEQQIAWSLEVKSKKLENNQKTLKRIRNTTELKKKSRK